MKKKHLKFLFTFLFICTILQVNGINSTGAVITYSVTNTPHQYQIKLERYLACGNTVSLSENVNFSNDCNSTSFQMTLNFEYSTALAQYCTTEVVNDCTLGGDSLGYTKRTYIGYITMSDTCSSWRINYSDNSRFSSNLSGANGLFVETIMNLSNNTSNSSAVIQAPQIPFVCVNTAISWNLGIHDVDNDSLHISLISPKIDASTSVSYLSGYSSLTPIPGITIDQSSRELNFTAMDTGKYTVAILIEEYNSLNVLVGSVIQDFIIVVKNCNNQLPSFSSTITNFNNNGTGASLNTLTNTVSMCDGDEFCLDITLTDANLSDNLTITSSILNNFPNATIITSGTNPIITTVCWQYQTGFTGSSILLKGEDNACPVYGIDFFELKLDIPLPLSVTYNDSICGNIGTELIATGTGPMNWSVLSGDPMAIGTNFSCNNCFTPIATPNMSTTYLLESANGCGQSETFTINVIDGNLGHIHAEILTNDTTICEGDCINVEAIAQINNSVITEYPININSQCSVPSNSTAGCPAFVLLPPTLTTITAGSIKSICFDIEYDGNVEDLDIYLQAPSGITFELSTANGGTGQNYLNTCFTIDAVDSVTLGTAPFSNNYIPEGGTLENALIGQPTQGIWRLEVTNNGSLNYAVVNNWSINFCATTFVNSTNAAVVWTINSGLDTVSTITNPTFCPIQNEEYVMKALDSNSCWASDTLNISVLPSANAGIDSVVVISIYAGAINLLDYLDGSPDTNGIWMDSLSLNVISGLVNPDTLPNLSTFMYIVENINGCLDTAFLTINAVDDLSIESLTNKLKFSFYPNPASNVLFFDYQKEVKFDNLKIGVYKITGEKVDQYTLKPNESKQNIDLANYSNGIYILKVFLDDELVKVEKVIVQK